MNWFGLLKKEGVAAPQINSFHQNNSRILLISFINLLRPCCFMNQLMLFGCVLSFWRSPWRPAAHNPHQREQPNINFIIHNQSALFSGRMPVNPSFLSINLPIRKRRLNEERGLNGPANKINFIQLISINSINFHSINFILLL